MFSCVKIKTKVCTKCKVLFIVLFCVQVHCLVMRLVSATQVKTKGVKECFLIDIRQTMMFMN